MSEINLLIFGCAVSFIAVAGAYLYLREGFTDEARSRESAPQSAKIAQQGVENVAWRGE
jgi:hypothetical protein